MNCRLEVKQAADGTQEVPGLVETRVYGADGVWEILKSGNRVRSVGSTSANELSSRSHWYVFVLSDELICNFLLLQALKFSII
jgi:kinesin family protein C2/C3